MNFENAYSELKEIREKGSRDSDRVIELWKACVRDLSYKLGDEVWVIYEQVFIAALDTAESRVAVECLEALESKFKKESSRIRRLYAMFLESQDSYDQARNIYQDLLTEDPTNALTMKRLIALNKAQGRNVEAIKDLNKYLESFMSDYEAWGQLCELYIFESDYKKAAFCMEELILSNPHNHLFHQMYAEIKYTEGGLENMEISRSYFAEACRLNNKNIRALNGLRLTNINIAQNNRSSKELKKECLKSLVWVDKTIAELYESVERSRSYYSNCNSKRWQPISNKSNSIDNLTKRLPNQLKITDGDHLKNNINYDNNKGAAEGQDESEEEDEEEDVENIHNEYFKHD